MGVGIFSDSKYNKPSQDALDFIRDQMRTQPSGQNGRLPVSYWVPSGDQYYNGVSNQTPIIPSLTQLAIYSLPKFSKRHKSSARKILYH